MSRALRLVCELQLFSREQIGTTPDNHGCVT